MATRRIKPTINNEYVQSLKIGPCVRMLLTTGTSYNSILFTKKHRACFSGSLAAKVWVKFASDNFDGIHLIGHLADSKDNIKSASSCMFTVYSVATDSTWSETLITSIAGVLSNNSFKAAIPQSAIDPTELDGEITLSIVADFERQGKKFRKKIYANHIGVYDSIFRLRQEVEFLDLTKVDE